MLSISLGWRSVMSPVSLLNVIELYVARLKYKLTIKCQKVEQQTEKYFVGSDSC